MIWFLGVFPVLYSIVWLFRFFIALACWSRQWWMAENKEVGDFSDENVKLR